METRSLANTLRPHAAVFVEDGEEFLRYRLHEWDAGSWCGTEYKYNSETGILEEESFSSEGHLYHNVVGPEDLLSEDREHFLKLLAFLDRHPELK